MVGLSFKLQRVGMISFFTCGILLLIYALGFISDVYIFYAYGNNVLVDFYQEMQGINAGLLWKAILIIIFALLLIFLELGKHHAGKITLVVVAAISAVCIFFGADSLSIIAAAREQYASLDLSSLNRYIERGAITYRYSTFTYDLGIGAYALFLLSCLFMSVTVICNAFIVEAKK
jgi:hypothetical protein